jgi:hypothetical protein
MTIQTDRYGFRVLAKRFPVVFMPVTRRKVQRQTVLNDLLVLISLMRLGKLLVIEA